MSQFPTVTHVIFDVDGLLLDTETIYTRIMQEMARPHGKEFTWAVKVKMMGRKEHEAAQVFIDELGVPITVEEYLAELKPLIEKKFPEAQLMPGAEKLIRHLQKHNVPMALATGSDSHFLQIKTQRHMELFSVFDIKVCSADDPDVLHGKPAPDVFLVAASRFKPQPQPEKALVFEDAPNGVEAGVAAGMPTIWIPDPNVDQSKLKVTPTQILSSLEEFQPELYGLPAYS